MRARLGGAFKAPMVADPGTRFVYGINTDWLGRVVEAVAGKTLDVLIKDRSPARSAWTTRCSGSTSSAANCVTVHVKGEDGAGCPPGRS